MKKSFYMGLTLSLVLVFLAGCITTSKIKNPSKISPKRSEKGLYSRVPAANRGPVREAQFDLKQSHTDVKMAKQKVQLAELLHEQALLRSRHADYGLKMAEILQKKAELAVEIRKFEAIDNSNLGDKEENIKKIANLKTKELSVVSDSVRVKAELDTLQVRIKKLTKKIRVQQKKLKR